MYIYKYLYDFLARDIHVGREIPPTRPGFQHRSMGFGASLNGQVKRCQARKTKSCLENQEKLDLKFYIYIIYIYNIYICYIIYIYLHIIYSNHGI